MLFNPVVGGGIKLPSLTNPAAAADIMQNKQAIDQSGQIIVGTKAPLPILSNPGSAGDLLSGKQLIDQNGNALTGTIPSKGASNLSASGATIIVQAGYYPSQVSKSVATATQATPTISVNSSGLITASATQSEGYVSAGTKSATQQLSVKTSSDVTASGATVTVPAGYYTSQVSKSVATATQATPSISVSTAGLITASVTQSAGYVSSGTKSATKQLTTQAGKTVTPGTTQQTAVASGRYTTGAVYVAGDSDLVASNIKSGVNIFGVTGTYTGTFPYKIATYSNGDFDIYTDRYDATIIEFLNGITITDVFLIAISGIFTGSGSSSYPDDYLVYNGLDGASYAQLVQTTDADQYGEVFRCIPEISSNQISFEKFTHGARGYWWQADRVADGVVIYS